MQGDPLLVFAAVMLIELVSPPASSAPSETALSHSNLEMITNKLLWRPQSFPSDWRNGLERVFPSLQS
jgi:hypothetical protein